jgi:hypothetical protein
VNPEVASVYGKLLSAMTTADTSIRFMSTTNGYVVTVRAKPQKAAPVPFIGMPPAHWVFRTEEAARVCFDFMVAVQRFWEAMVRDEPREHLLTEAERLSKLSRETIGRLNDQPVQRDETRGE